MIKYQHKDAEIYLCDFTEVSDAEMMTYEELKNQYFIYVRLNTHLGKFQVEIRMQKHLLEKMANWKEYLRTTAWHHFDIAQ